MRRWVSPVPYGVGNVCRSVRVFRPGTDVRVMASAICDDAWKGKGVRVFRWPCDTVASVAVGHRADIVLLRDALPHLFATYARDGAGMGPRLIDVIHALDWARATH